MQQTRLQPRARSGEQRLRQRRQAATRFQGLNFCVVPARATTIFPVMRAGLTERILSVPGAGSALPGPDRGTKGSSPRVRGALDLRPQANVRPGWLRPPDRVENKNRISYLFPQGQGSLAQQARHFAPRSEEQQANAGRLESGDCCYLTMIAAFRISQPEQLALTRLHASHSRSDQGLRVDPV